MDMLDMTTNRDHPRQPEPTDRRRLVLGVGWTLLIFVLCLFLPAGTWAWSRGWLFFVVTVAAGVVITLFLNRVNPDVVAARANRHEGTKGWDRILLSIFLPAVVLIPILAALDDRRFHWSHVPWWICGIGYILLIAGMAGMTWAETVNKHFEPTVRIQTDRGHTVIDTGPYAIVRHPGYVAASLMFVGIALSLGSLWALIPAAVSCLLLVVRTVLEDRTLRAELSGYEEYARRVRFRLLPGVW
jgi:protein-S-isoprenylcysteine O-methyltransferase Ste14